MLIDTARTMARSARHPRSMIWRPAAESWRQRGWEWRFRVDSFRHAPVVVTDRFGTRLVLYEWQRRHATDLVWRPHDLPMFRAMELFVHPGDVVFDVGANDGSESVFAARRCGDDGRVFAFEPAPETYQRLRETVTLNAADNVTIHPFAITDTVGTVELHLFDTAHSGWNSLGRPAMPAGDGATRVPEQSVLVPAETLDHFCAERDITAIDFLKVDVEGYERAVFDGADGLLRQQQIASIWFEISSEPLKGAGATAGGVFGALTSRGYHIYRFHGGYDRNRLHGDSELFEGPLAPDAEASRLQGGRPEGDALFWDNYLASCRPLPDHLAVRPA